MKIAKLFKPPEASRLAAEFISKHYADQTAKDYFSDPKFQKFLQIVKNGTWADASKEYRRVTGEGIQDSIIAAEVARILFGSRTM